jgi:hypothetical protein
MKVETNAIFIKNKIGKVYSLEYTDIPKVFFTDRSSHCCATMTLVMQVVCLPGKM